VLTRKDKLTILIWERKVLRRIFGPMCERGCYRIKTNEVYRIYQELDLVTLIKTLRLKLLGHVNRIEDHRECCRVFLGVGEEEEIQEKGGWMTWKMISGRLELNGE
jgi:Tfp pilus assembly protein PilZ